MSDELTPIIFIPGLMGSMGGEMLGCKSNWGFGVAGWFYKPFIRQLENLGYTLNEDLFVCYYDWRKNCSDVVRQFLLPLLLEVEDKWPNKKVDLLCHSMGGLVGRSYIQSREYGYNIRNLMVFGTPNRGNVEAYYLWSTGKTMAKASEKNPLFKIIKSGYIWLITKLLDIPLGRDNIEKLHENFEGLGDLLPTYDYGYALCYKNNNNTYTYIPSKYIKYKNDFVSQLNKNIALLNNRLENIYSFVGTDKETDKILIVDKKPFLNNKYEDIRGSLSTKEGDGTVIVKSATIDYGETFVMKEGHMGILTSSVDYIADIYNLDKTLIKKDIIEIKGQPLGIIFKSHTNMELRNKEEAVTKFIGGQITTKYEFVVEEFAKDYTWIIFRDLPVGEYVLEILGEDAKEFKEDYSIFVVGTRVEEEVGLWKMEEGKRAFNFSI